MWIGADGASAAAHAGGEGPARADFTQAFARTFDISANGLDARDPAVVVTPDTILFVAWGRDPGFVAPGDTVPQRTAYTCSADGALSFYPPSWLEAPGVQPAVAYTPAGSLLLANVAQDSIRCSRSLDAGRSFLPAVTQVQGIPSPEFPSLAVDVQGLISLGWDVNSTTVYYSKSVTEGVTFTPPLAISANEGAGFVQDRPKLAVDGQRTIYAAWNHWRSFGLQKKWVAFSRSTNLGVNFSVPKAISDTLRNAYDPTVIARGSGVVDIMWVYAGVVDSVVVYESTNQGSTFGRLAAVAVPGQGGGTLSGPSFVRAGDGTLHTVVESVLLITNKSYYCALPPGGAFFTSPVEFSSSPGGRSSPVVTLDLFGTPILVWSSNIARGQDIVFTRKLP